MILLMLTDSCEDLELAWARLRHLFKIKAKMALILAKPQAERDFTGRHLLQRRTASRFSMIYASPKVSRSVLR
jgi:hypothetical protein